MTLAQYQAHREEIQYVIFDLPKEIGLEPMLFSGGGHINIGAAAFENNRELLRLFIIDYLNHSELSMGIFNYDTNNALNYWLVPQGSANVLNTLERLKQPTSQLTNPEFANMLSEALSTMLVDEYLVEFRIPHPNLIIMRRNSWALAFKKNEVSHHLDNFEYWRLEIRAVRPQASIDVFIRQATLLQKRLNFIKETGGANNIASLVPIEYQRPLSERLFTPPIDPQLALQSFYNYVTESGLDWADHQDYLWPLWISGGQLKQFNDQLQSSCNVLLSSPDAVTE